MYRSNFGIMWSMYIYVHTCQMFVLTCESISCVWIPRLQNVVADELAKHSLVLIEEVNSSPNV